MHRASGIIELQPGRTTISALLKSLPSSPPRPHFSQQACEAILAGADKGRSAMIEAALTYFHGTYLGKPCVAVDYDKAFALLRRAGANDAIAGLTRVLKLRAASGNPRAITALKHLGVPAR